MESSAEEWREEVKSWSDFGVQGRKGVTGSLACFALLYCRSVLLLPLVSRAGICARGHSEREHEMLSRERAEGQTPSRDARGCGSGSPAAKSAAAVAVARHEGLRETVPDKAPAERQLPKSEKAPPPLRVCVRRGATLAASPQGSLSRAFRRQHRRPSWFFALYCAAFPLFTAAGATTPRSTPARRRRGP